MSDISIDTDFVHWFEGYGPKEMGGSCSHGCPHQSVKDIAWGPDLDRYTLNECSDCGCRAWLTADQGQSGSWKDANWLSQTPTRRQDERPG